MKLNRSSLLHLQVDQVLDIGEDIVDRVLNFFSKASETSQVHVDELNVSRGAAEQALAKYSVVGQLIVNVAGEALRAVPFCAPAAALLGCIYSRSVQVCNPSMCRDVYLRCVTRMIANSAGIHFKKFEAWRPACIRTSTPHRICASTNANTSP